MTTVTAGKLRLSRTAMYRTVPRGDPLAPAVKLAGFLVLLVAVFAGAYAAGGRFGPLTTGQSRIQYSPSTGGGPGMGGMNMGMGGSP